MTTTEDSARLRTLVETGVAISSDLSLDSVLERIAKAAATLAAIYLVGILIIWLGPETKGKPLPEHLRDV